MAVGLVVFVAGPTVIYQAKGATTVMKNLTSLVLAEAQELQRLALDCASTSIEGLDDARSISVVVVDAHGFVLLSLRQDGASFASIRAAELKARQAALYGRSTVEEAHELQSGLWVPKKVLDSDTDNRRLCYPEYTTWAGGVTVARTGWSSCGGLGVSGRSQLDDHFIAKTAVDNWNHDLDHAMGPTTPD